jgi:predicted PP-loop superfamily ATPase
MLYTASWIKKRPAYWINGKRVSRQEGYESSEKYNCPLPHEFHDWHQKNDPKVK